MLDGWDRTDQSEALNGGFNHIKIIFVNWFIAARSLKSINLSIRILVFLIFLNAFVIIVELLMG